MPTTRAPFLSGPELDDALGRAMVGDRTRITADEYAALRRAGLIAPNGGKNGRTFDVTAKGMAWYNSDVLRGGDAG